MGAVACQTGESEADRQQLQALDATLQTLNRQQNREADRLMGRMQEAVALTRFYPADVTVLEKAETVRSRANTVRGRIKALRNKLLQAANQAGGAGLGGTQPVAATLLGPDEAANLLQQSLRQYARHIRQVVPDMSDLLAADAKDDPSIRAAVGDAFDGQSFGEFYFGSASVAAALTTLSQKEGEVLRMELLALEELSKKIQHADAFFKIGAYAIPNSNTVREGQHYEADLFLTTSRQEVFRVAMQANGRSVKIGPYGAGQIAFPVPATAPSGPAFWEASISGSYRGRDTTFRFRVPYTIQRQ
ncbi:hypothetical protein [Hymenobacter busanensis]|nr:hypothetical protein [Hymenobacter busanensis]QHJ06552.1 hypothetical protein GUY19_04250 [Hymenobacter busanensis]